MVLYTCYICNFSSSYTTNYHKHCMSRKHLRNLEKYESQKNMVSNKKNNNLVTKNNTVVTHEVTQSNTEIDTENQYICEFCNKKFKHSNSYYRHCKHYCLQKKELLEDKIEIQKLKDEVKNLKESINNKPTNTTNTTNNININTTNYIKNDKVLNYLNSNHSDVIEMDSFIHKLKNDTLLSREMMDCFITCYNHGGVDSFGTTLVKYLNQICKQLDINIFPLCCSDSNLRSHKEKNEVGWETVIDTKKIEEIINQIVTDIFMETDTMINLDSRERKKICNIVKKSYGLSSLKMLDELEDSSEIYIPLES